MSTDDISHRYLSCPCGKGTVTITIASPDHPWARPSQTAYDAVIDCKECAANFVVHSTDYNKQPDIVPRQQFDDMESKKAAYWALSKEIEESERSAQLRKRIAKRIDEAPSKAAAHREMVAMGISRDSYQTYLRHPYDGDTAARRANGRNLANLGCGDLGGDDKAYFLQMAMALEGLDEAWRSVKLVPINVGPVKTPT